MIENFLKKSRAVLGLLLLIPLVTTAQIDLLQTTDNAIVTGMVPSCQGGGATLENAFGRLYNLENLGYDQFTVTKVSFAVDQFVLGSATSFSVTVNIFASTGGILASNLTYLGGQSVDITATQCGQQVAQVSTLVATTSLPNVSLYRFRVTILTNTDGPNAVQVIDRGLHWFSLTMLERYNYGTTYSVEVAVKTLGGSFTPYGASCTVMSPSVPEINVCGTVIPALTAKIATTSLLGVTQYRFEVTNTQTQQTEIIDRALNWFSMNMIPELQASTDYLVRVSVMTKGTFSPYSNGCIITSPAAARENVKNALTTFEAVAYPNPYAIGV